MFTLFLWLFSHLLNFLFIECSLNKKNRHINKNSIKSNTTLNERKKKEMYVWDLSLKMTGKSQRKKNVLSYTHTHTHTHTYTRCPGRNVPEFGRMFLKLKYTDITQNTYIQSWMVMEIIAREVWKYDSCYTLIDY